MDPFVRSITLYANIGRQMDPNSLKVIAKATMMWNMTGLSDRVLQQMPMGMTLADAKTRTQSNLQHCPVLEECP